MEEPTKNNPFLDLLSEHGVIYIEGLGYFFLFKKRQRKMIYQGKEFMTDGGFEPVFFYHKDEVKFNNVKMLLEKFLLDPYDVKVSDELLVVSDSKGTYKLVDSKSKETLVEIIIRSAEKTKQALDMETLKAKQKVKQMGYDYRLRFKDRGELKQYFITKDSIRSIDRLYDETGDMYMKWGYSKDKDFEEKYLTEDEVGYIDLTAEDFQGLVL